MQICSSTSKIRRKKKIKEKREESRRLFPRRRDQLPEIKSSLVPTLFNLELIYPNVITRATWDLLKNSARMVSFIYIKSVKRVIDFFFLYFCLFLRC
ncbi:hypothetical protein PUN28_007515 [Cardiocondyla obscurior]|uniref:Uncharacterized protein n=1 Tax=Cardiocondyla obscurior TaxID=286306 RepID=A0AAW2G5R9_9HYME